MPSVQPKISVTCAECGDPLEIKEAWFSDTAVVEFKVNLGYGCKCDRDQRAGYVLRALRDADHHVRLSKEEREVLTRAAELFDPSDGDSDA